VCPRRWPAPSRHGRAPSSTCAGSGPEPRLRRRRGRGGGRGHRRGHRGR
jgi:hypothetical protein